MREALGLVLMALIVISSALVGPSKPVGAADPPPLRGVNLAGLEFGEGNLPGVYNTDYTSPTTDELDFFKSAGITVVRLPFRWERIQQVLNGPLDPANVGYLDAIVDAAAARDMKVLLDPHNYGRYKINGVEYIIGSPQVPREAFYDFWTKMAEHFASKAGIYAYGLMNEPHDMGSYDWKTTAQGAVSAIRTKDTLHTIAVPGDGWSGAWHWDTYSQNLIINDPANNIVYEAHQYFDRDGSGTYRGGRSDPNIGVDRLQPFLDWLHSNSLKGFIGEFGVPPDSGWMITMDTFLTKLDQEGVNAFYWAAGPWWGDYALSIDPSKSNIPQLQVLVNHTSAGGTAPEPWPSFTLTATSAPHSARTGDALQLSVSLAADRDSSGVLVDIEVYDSSDNQVAQQLSFGSNGTGESFAAGQANTYTMDFTPTAAGVYTLKVGVFGADWHPLYDWLNSVAPIRVR